MILLMLGADLNRVCQENNRAMELSLQEQIIRSLLDHLVSKDHQLDGGQTDGQWQGWRIRRVAGGRNNLLYRAFGPLGDLAIKFTIRDERDRAGREYGALTVLRQAGLSIAPEPILLDRTSYAQPVVVQSWLEGEVSETPPTTDDEWQELVHHVTSVHTVTPEKTGLRLYECVLNPSTVEEGRQLVREQMARLPRRAQPATLQALVHRLGAFRFPEWTEAPITLCRLDNSTTNYIRRPGRWASVDWEYSGWGDPAFDVANLMTHVAFKDVPPARWNWFVDRCCGLMADATAAVRIRAYREIMLVWWCARLARYLYEFPRGLDERLAAWPAGWQVDIEAKYEHYLGLAEAVY